MNLYLSFTILSLRLHIHNLECRRLDALMTAMGALAWVLYLAALLEHKATRPAEGGIHYQAFLVMRDRALDVIQFLQNLPHLCLVYMAEFLGGDFML